MKGIVSKTLGERAEHQIKIMYKDFELMQIPKTPNIRIGLTSRKNANGEFIRWGNGRIVINEEEKEELRKYFLAHEIGHFLHWQKLGNENWINNSHTPSRVYEDFIAESSALSYLEKIEEIEEYTQDILQEEGGIYYKIYKIFQDNPNLWRFSIIPTRDNIAQINWQLERLKK